jgi:uncharacterized protein (TIGR03435 family)
MRHLPILAVTIAASALWAQSPTFEAATVKINNSNSGATAFPGIRNGMLTGTNATLHEYLRAAYDLSESRIFGPAWLDTDKYDISAKPPQGATPAEILQMLRPLLNDRFQMTTHREMRELPVFEMVVAKGGVKMALSTPEQPFPKPPANPGGAMNMGAGTMPQIAQRLGGAAGRPILDKTGLDGKYGFLLIYARPSPQPQPQLHANAPPDFFTAVEQQLGLKLVPAKAPVEVLVVDRAERIPTPN